MIKLDTINKFFKYWWEKEGTWIEEPNQRRGGFSGVLTVTDNQQELLYIKRQESHIFRSLRYPFTAPTILREYYAYLALNKISIKTPELVYCGIQNKKAILVTKSLTNFISLEQWLNNRKLEPYNQKISLLVMENIAKTLAHLHKNRLQHNCLHSKHFFIKINEETSQPTVEVALLDLEKMRKRFFIKKAASHDMRHMKKHTKTLLFEHEWQHLITVYTKTLGKIIDKLT